MIRTSEREPGEHDNLEDIAIVGMSCLFPGADRVDKFWQNIVGKVDCITEAPPDWQPELFYDPRGPEFDKSYVRRGGFVGDLCRFNPMKYGVPPSAIEGAEPDHFIALRCAFEAMEDAGFPEIPVNRDKTGVIVGRGIFVNRGWVAVFQRLFAVDQLLSVLRTIEPHRTEEDLNYLAEELKRRLPPANADTFPGLVHSALVGRIANRLDLNGPAYTLDAACASVSLCVEHATRELRSGRCDAVIVGGSQVSLPAPVHIMFCHLEALSREGLIAPFSAQATGTVLGQGCGMLVLKRRTDAEQDGNRIYALIKGVGSSSDGKGAGILAPRTEGQQLSINRAYEQSHVPRSKIDLIEAHGTGIPMGDATEIETLTACFAKNEIRHPGVAIGSIKSMIGHLIPASGAASLIKTALAVYHRTLPPTLHAAENHPDLHLEDTMFYTCDEPRPWLRQHNDAPRRAGVNAFGFGGINAHVILEEHTGADEDDLDDLDWEWPAELVLVSAADRESLAQRAESLATWVEKADGARLLDIAATAATESGPSRLAVVATSKEDLAGKLRTAAKRLGEPKRNRIQTRNGTYWYEEPLANGGRTAFVFPGEGSQYPKMHEALCRHFPEVRREFELTGLALEARGDTDPLGKILFPQPRDLEWAEDKLLQMDIAVATVTAAARGMLQLLRKTNIKPDAVVGHSSGEFAAVLAAGAFVPVNEEELIHSIVSGLESTARVAGSDLVGPAALVAVGGTEPGAVNDVVEASAGRITVAMDNCPHQVVLVGDEEAMETALESLKGRGGLCRRIPWNRPYHTEACAPVCKFVEEYAEGLRIKAPETELWSCVTAAAVPNNAEEVKRLTAIQWKSRVRFRETIEAMHDAGYRIFVEVGPRNILSSFISDTLGDRPHAAVPMDVQQKDGIEQLCRAVGMIAAQGVDVSLAALFKRRNPVLLDFSASPPAAPKPDPILRLELPLFELDGEALEKSKSIFSVGSQNPGSAAVPAAAPAPETPSSPNPAAASDRDRVFAEFQQTMQQFLDTQQTIMTSLPARGVPGSQPEARQAGAAVLNRPAPAPTPAPQSAPGAFLENVMEHEPSRRLTAEVEFDVARHSFLRDHSFFGGTVSVHEPALHALPVMPLVISLELMAEAASILSPGNEITAVSDIEISGWLAFETPTRRVRVEAETAGNGNVISQVFEEESEGKRNLLVHATIELGHDSGELGAPQVQDTSSEPPPWRDDEIYDKILYHGPAFQGIERVEAWSPEGIRASVRALDPALLATRPSVPLALPVQLVDTASQIPAMVYTNWKLEGPTCRCAFPNRIKRLEFTKNFRADEPLVGVAKFQRRETGLISDVEISTAAGKPVLRYLGRVEEGVDFPLLLYRYAFSPRENRAGEDITDWFSNVPEIDACRIGWVAGDSMKLFVHRLWSTVLARTVLNRAEQERFADSRLPPVARTGWLLGRIASKEVVRLLLGADLCLADIEIRKDAGGKPSAITAGHGSPAISFSHALFAAVAVAADSDRFRGVGIDLEPLQPLSSDVIEDSFHPSERDQIEAVGGNPNEWYLRGWTAKEAAGKACGTGVVGGPLGIRIDAIDTASGQIDITLCGAMQRATEGLLEEGQSLRAFTVCRDDHVLSLCLLK